MFEDRRSEAGAKRTEKMRQATSNGGALNERASERTPTAFCCPHCRREIALGGAGLSAPQRDVLTFIAKYIAENRRSPSMGDIAEALSYPSRTRAFTLVTQLCAKGMLSKVGGPNSARNIIVTDVGEVVAR